MTKKTGRPSTYSRKKADYICRELAKGRTLRAICREKNTPHEATVRVWARDDVDGFFERFIRARDVGIDAIVDETLEISDAKEGDPKRDRLRVDTRKWYAAKMAPKRYSDRQYVDHSSSDGSMTPKPTKIELVAKPVEAEDDAS